MQIRLIIDELYSHNLVLFTKNCLAESKRYSHGGNYSSNDKENHYNPDKHISRTHLIQLSGSQWWSSRKVHQLCCSLHILTFRTHLQNCASTSGLGDFVLGTDLHYS